MVAEGCGSWLEYIEFEGKLYWTIDMEKGFWKRVDDKTLPEEQREFLLPSDSSLRADYPFLVSKDYDEAEIQKNKIEE